MFGAGIACLLLVIHTIMSPAILCISISIVAAFVASFLSAAYMAELSDKTLAQDLQLIKGAFDTDALLANTPTQRDMVSYYTRTTDLDYSFLALFIGPGLHTRLRANYPILSHTGNARQVMYALTEITAVRAGRRRNPEQKTKVLELGFGRGYCTLMLAGLLPPTEFEFHGIDLVQRHVDIARADAAEYPNVHFKHGDAALSSSYDGLLPDDAAFDVIFAIESLCHTDNNTLATVAQRLTPGGRLVIIDGFRSENFAQAPANQQLAMRLAERAFSLVHPMRPYSEWVEEAYPAGLELKSLNDLTAHALPFWTLGWRFAHAFLRHAPAWVIRRLRATPYTARSTDNLLAVATVAHAMRDRASAAYGVLVFSKKRGVGR
jgi:SAM-dependent methyltransferase